MSTTIQNLVLSSFIDLYNTQPHLFAALPELSFVAPLATKIKAKGCTCGMGGELKTGQDQLNALARSLSEEAATRFKAVLQREQLCFGIVEPTSFETKCY